MRNLLLAALPLLLIFSIFACKKPAEVSLSNSRADDEHVFIKKIHLQDSIPKRFLTNVPVNEINGIKATYTSGSYTSYFEYEADANKMLTLISSLPFKRTDIRCDTLCRNMQTDFSLSGKKILSKEELVTTDFFWDINPQDYTYYECIKAPSRHTILVHKKTNRILHRIESSS